MAASLRPANMRCCDINRMRLTVQSASPVIARHSNVVRAQRQEQLAMDTACAPMMNKLHDRRHILGVLVGAVVWARSKPAAAAYGESANVFGKASNNAGFIPYAGEGFALLIPSKWNPSRERDFPGIQLRYEDNSDSISNLSVIVNQTDKSSIKSFGPPDKFLDQIKFLLGEQTFKGETQSEGGFAANKVASAALLGVQEVSDRQGKPLYKYEIFTRTADGDEGGRHYLLTATVSGGKLYILKVQIGDKRWFKGADRYAKGVWDSFTVA